jgi:hypothetical protein
MMEGCGPSQPRCADTNTTSRRRRSGRPPGLWSTLVHSDMEGCGPSQPRCADTNTTSRRRRSGRPPGLWSTLVHSDMEGCGPSQPRFADITPLHGADGADALQAIGQQWLLRTPLQPLLKHGALVSVAQNLVTIRHTALSPFAGYL